MSSEHYKKKCQVCSREFDYGPHVYQGRYLPRYQMVACNSCLRAHHDGWGLEAEKCILQHLNQSGIDVPERNAVGLLPTE